MFLTKSRALIVTKKQCTKKTKSRALIVDQKSGLNCGKISAYTGGGAKLYCLEVRNLDDLKFAHFWDFRKGWRGSVFSVFSYNRQNMSNLYFASIPNLS